MTTPIEPVDMINQLVSAHDHAEAYTHESEGTTYTQRHIVRAPALLDQLSHNQPTTSSRAAIGGSGFESKPAAFIEAIDALTLIDNQSARWVRHLGHDDPGTTKRCVRYLGSLLPGLKYCGHTSRREPGQAPQCCDRHAIEYDIRNWWTQARILSGWDTSAFKPRNTCPLCGFRGSLRIRVTDHTALCVECHATWTTDTIGLLAEHIRLENGEQGDDAIGDAIGA